MFSRILLGIHLDLVFCFGFGRLFMDKTTSIDVGLFRLLVFPCHKSLGYATLFYKRLTLLHFFVNMKICFTFHSFSKTTYSYRSFVNVKWHNTNFQKVGEALCFMPFWLKKSFIGTLQFLVWAGSCICLSCVNFSNLCLFQNYIISSNYQVCKHGVFLY